MPFHRSGLIRYFEFESLMQAGAFNAVVTRQGGVSPSPWSSLNVGGTVGDDPNRVSENRSRLFHALDISTSSVFDVWQVHGVQVVCTNTARPQDEMHQKADAILTDNLNVTLFMRFADCVPIFLFDPVKNVIGLVHAGWQGTVKGVINHTVAVMESRYDSKTNDIMAGIGPSIGPDHYEVGEDVALQVRRAFGGECEKLLCYDHSLNGQTLIKFDLWQANRYLLQQAGLQIIEIAGICTACHLKDWYSHRAEKGATGRFGAIISLL
jgi:polyphenol oxidase